MADLYTHLTVGVYASAAAVFTLNGLGIADSGQGFALFALGVLGSVLPDIDAEPSPVVRALFGALGAALAFGWTLPLVGRHPPLELVLVWAGLFVATRYLLVLAFARFTVHRGIWHSLLAAAFVTLMTLDLAHWVLHQSVRAAWSAGLMVGLGYLTHLTLDELYGVDLSNVRVRRSFGTALKPFSPSDPASSLMMAAAVAVLAWFAPAPEFGRFPDWTAGTAWAVEVWSRLVSWVETGIHALRAWLHST